jgi:hypothetical protein
MCQATASCPTKVSPFRLFGRTTLTPSVTSLVCRLTWTTLRATVTKQTQRDPRRPTEVFVGPLMVRQPLPPSHLPPLSHSLFSFPAIRPRLHLLIPQEFLRSSPLAQGTSSIASQGPVLLLSLANCSTWSVFLSSATFAPCTRSH